MRAQRAMNQLLPEKPMRLRERRRRARFAKMGLALCAIVIVFLALVGAAHLSILSIRSVEVAGTAIDADSIAAVVFSTLGDRYAVYPRRNIFLYPRVELRDNLLSTFPRIHSVSLERLSFFSTVLRIAVEERVAQATWCDSQCYHMDAEGYIFDLAGTGTSTGYIFGGGLLPNEKLGQQYLRGRLQAFVSLLDSMGDLGLDVTGALVETDTDYLVRTSQGPDIRASFVLPDEYLLANLRGALGSEVIKSRLDSLEYIDLRFPGKIYYR